MQQVTKEQIKELMMDQPAEALNAETIGYFIRIFDEDGDEVDVLVEEVGTEYIFEVTGDYELVWFEETPEFDAIVEEMTKRVNESIKDNDLTKFELDNKIR